MSACPPTAAQNRTFNHFGFGPNPDIDESKTLALGPGHEKAKWDAAEAAAAARGDAEREIAAEKPDAAVGGGGRGLAGAVHARWLRHDRHDGDDR